MRKVAMVVGLLFLLGGALGLTYHVFHYLYGSYESSARLQIGYTRILTNTDPAGKPPPIDVQADAAQVAEYVREKLIYGSVYAGVPMAFGCILVFAAWRWKKAPAERVSPGVTDGPGAV